jgi:hypothetical protein
MMRMQQKEKLVKQKQQMAGVHKAGGDKHHQAEDKDDSLRVEHVHKAGEDKHLQVEDKDNSPRVEHAHRAEADSNLVKETDLLVLII